MEKARKETESTRCPRPGLIPAVLKGISSRETFLAVKCFWQSAAGAQGQQVSPFLCFFSSFSPNSALRGRAPRSGTTTKGEEGHEQGGQTLKTGVFLLKIGCF